MKSGVHCIELNSGSAFSGILTITAEEMHVDFFGYGKSPSMSCHDTIFLRTEDSRLVSLHTTLAGGCGRSGRGGQGPDTPVYSERIFADIAVSGNQKWEKNDPIKHVCFRLNHTQELLSHKDTYNILRDVYNSGRNRTLFERKIGNLKISCSFNGVWHMPRKEPTEWWPELEIEFHDPVSIFNYLDSVKTVTSFFSFCLGAHLTPSKIRVYKRTLAEVTQVAMENGILDEFNVSYVWPEKQVDRMDTRRIGSPVGAWEDNEVAALCQCLTAWIERENSWKNSTFLMMGALSSKQEMSAERLIQACRWFEEIPLTRVQQAIKQSDMELIAKAAANKARELGYNPLCGRIQGELKKIGSESRRLQLERLVNTVTVKFGEGILRNSVIYDLQNAISFRGKSAHGHIDVSDENEFRDFARAVCAMEALCYLLTALDLPISNEGIQRVRDNPLVRDYRICL